MSGSVPPTGYGQGASRDAVAMMRYDAAKTSTGVAYLLWFFVGWLGIHRFYLGRTGTGVAMLIIFLVSTVLSLVVVGLFGFLVLGIWWLVDAFLIPGLARAQNERLIDQIRR
jgi:TM2 domain-containing membrane protein YozV